MEMEIPKVAESDTNPRIRRLRSAIKLDNASVIPSPKSALDRLIQLSSLVAKIFFAICDN